MRVRFVFVSVTVVIEETAGEEQLRRRVDGTSALTNDDNNTRIFLRNLCATGCLEGWVSVETSFPTIARAVKV